MPDTQFYTKEAALAKAEDIKTALAVAKLRLFQSSLVPNSATTRVQLLAAEANFDGYTAGGYTLTAWTGPNINLGGGAILTAPLANPAFSAPSDPPVTNVIGGGWVEDAANAVRFVFTYDPPRNMLQVGDGWPIVAQIVEGKNGGV